MKFTLTTDHVKLLRAMYVDWCNDEAGAPAINPKRPYGNSYVEGDVAEILGWKVEGGELSDEQNDLALKLHSETQTALQIILVTGSFTPGVYLKTESYSARSWVKVPA